MMKLFFYTVVLGFSLGLSACTDTPDTAISTSPSSAKMTSIDFNSPDIYKPMKGIYTFGEGVETFTPCGSKNDYWVYTTTEDMWTSLRDTHNASVAEPYEGIFVEVYGWLGPKLHPIVGGEYASESDGHIVIEEVTAMKKKSSSDCK